MLLLFASFFFASVIFLVFFLMDLQNDIKRESITPLFKVIPAIGFWIGTLPALLSPELSYTVTTGSAITTLAPAALSVRVYNAFFYIWLIILTMIFFLIILWYINMIRQKTARLLKEGGGAISGFEDHYGK
jgi:preprotein translocase subunit SecY